MGRAHEKRHICKCLISHAKNSLRMYNQKNSGYTKIRRKIRQQKIPKTDSKFLHIELLSREAWTSKDTRFLTPSRETLYSPYFMGCTAYFPLVSLFGNLLPPLTLFLDFFHFLFCDKLIVRPKAAYLMQRIREPFPLI